MTVLLITQYLWNLGLTWGAPFLALFVDYWLDFLLSAMEGFPLSMGGCGASSSKQPGLPDLNLPPPENQDQGARSLKP